MKKLFFLFFLLIINHFIFSSEISTEDQGVVFLESADGQLTVGGIMLALKEHIVNSSKFFPSDQNEYEYTPIKTPITIKYFEGTQEESIKIETIDVFIKFLDDRQFPPDAIITFEEVNSTFTIHNN